MVIIISVVYFDKKWGWAWLYLNPQYMANFVEIIDY